MSTHIENIDLVLNQFPSGIVTIAQRGDQFIVIPPEEVYRLANFFDQAAREVMGIRLKRGRQAEYSKPWTSDAS